MTTIATESCDGSFRHAFIVRCLVRYEELIAETIGTIKGSWI